MTLRLRIAGALLTVGVLLSVWVLPASADVTYRLLLDEETTGAASKGPATDLASDLRIRDFELEPILNDGLLRGIRKAAGKTAAGERVEATVQRLERWRQVRVPRSRRLEFLELAGSDPRVLVLEEALPARLSAIPDDSLFVNQAAYIGQVELVPAWDLVRGSSGDVVIAIVDGGTEWRHPDLVDNVWTNPGEIADNGIDDDGNGFVDDVRGWNFALDGPDPTGLPELTFNRLHGTHVAGLAAARADNGIGVVGSSWNARFMPINASHPEQDSSIAFGYQGILYAASMGADIINCSWARSGSPGSPARASDFERDVVDVARELGSLVVVAAGNDSQQDFPAYPAFYPSTLAVAATTFSTQALWIGSNRDFWVDLAAPGRTMMSTVADGGYAVLGGTSMSAPVVAGVAALVKTRHPDWSPEMIRQQLRWTGLDLEPANPGYEGRIGGGMVQARSAVAESVPGVHALDLRIFDQDGDGLPEGGETLTFGFTLVNELARAENVLVRFATDDPYLVPLEDAVRIPVLESGGRLQVVRGLSAWLDHVVPLGHRPTIRLEIEVGGRRLVDVFYPELAPLSAVVGNEGIEYSLTANGKVGYSDPTRPYELGGIGLRRPGRRSAHLGGGLLIGSESGVVSNAVQPARPNDAFEDFRPIQGQGLERVDAIGRSEVRASFSDRGVSPRLSVGVTQRAMAFDDPEAVDFVLQVTDVESQVEDLAGVRVGMLVDWEMTGFGSDEDEILIDPSSRMVMVHSFNPSDRKPAWAGVAVLEGPGSLSSGWLHDIGPVEGEPFLYDTTDLGAKPSDATLWELMSGPALAGNSPVGGYTSVFAMGPVDLLRGEKTRLVVAWVMGSGPEELRTAAERARVAWSSLEEGFGGSAPTTVRLLPSLPNPMAESGVVRFALPSAGTVRLQVYDSRGRRVAKLLDEVRPAGFHRVGWDGQDDDGRRLARGVYHLRLSAGGRTATRSMVLLRP